MVRIVLRLCCMRRRSKLLFCRDDGDDGDDADELFVIVLRLCTALVLRITVMDTPLLRL